MSALQLRTPASRLAPLQTPAFGAATGEVLGEPRAAQITQLPFVAARGIPQTIPFDAGERRLQLTIVATVTDLPALASMPQTHVLFNGAALETARSTVATSEGEDEEDRTSTQSVDTWTRFRASAPSSLSPSVLRPYLVIRDANTLLCSRPILTGTWLRAGVTSDAALLVEVRFTTLLVTVGSLTQPGEFGGAITAEIRVLTGGTLRFVKSHGREEDLYNALV